MGVRFIRGKETGQSIPLIALVLVVLIAMVGMSVDVGNTYAEQRNTVRGVNAAALAGMDMYTRNASDQSIAMAINNSLVSNGLEPISGANETTGSDQRRIVANYLNSKGNYLGGGCNIGNCARVPDGVTYIRVQASGEIDTYFARVVNRQTLPVDATAFAAACFPTNGVYPIAVSADDISTDTNQFKSGSPPEDKNPYTMKYKDADYPTGVVQRRIFAKTNVGTPGSFSYLRWREDNNEADGGNPTSATALARMLSDSGSLAAGFDEAGDSIPANDQWPDKLSPKPTNYPFKPNQLNPGDWIHASTGWVNSSAVNAALQKHITEKTVMYLPIFDKAAGVGNNAAIRLSRLGKFYLRGKGTDPKGQGYFDLVFLGDAKQNACLETNVVTNKNLGIVGEVLLNPAAKGTADTNQPISYQIILDSSGSMSWDFNGYGTYTDGKDYQCENPERPNPLNLSYNPNCRGGPNSAWKNVSERRVYVAKQAIIKFIDKMSDADTMRIIAFTGEGDGKQEAKAYPASDWSSDKEMLKKAVLDAGKAYGDPYRTAGLTPGAYAIQQAGQMLSKDAPTTAPDGRTYRRATIYLTDGVANVFLKSGESNIARDVCNNMNYNQALNTVIPCQWGVTSSGVRRPVQEMVYQASIVKKNNVGIQLFTIALAGVDSRGLPMVASDRSMAYEAKSPGVVDQIFSTINERVENASCIPIGSNDYVSQIDAAHTAGSLADPYTIDAKDLADGAHGYVTIYDKTGNTQIMKVPIKTNPETGNLGYTISADAGLAPGDYIAEAFVNYRSTEDDTSRTYNTFVVGTDTSTRVAFNVSGSSSLGQEQRMDTMYLNLSVNVCPAS